MNESEIPIIGAKKKMELELEVPATFHTVLLFTNHSGEFTKMEFALPPGVYPNPTWMPKLIEEAHRNALKTLKLSTKDLSWRKPTTQEFLAVTAGPQAKNYSVNIKWAEPYASKMDLNLPDVEAAVDDNSN